MGSRQGSNRAANWIILLLLAGLICLSRLRTYSEPVEWDIGTYAVIAHELNRGEKLYLDVWDMKPPAIFATYQVAEWLAGYGFGQIYLLGTFAAIVTMLGIYVAGSVFGSSAGLFAAACFAIMQSDMGLEANRPNTEAFINACTAWAFAMLLQVPADRAAIGRAIVIGALIAVGSLYKHVAVAIFVPVLIVDAVFRARVAMMRIAVLMLSFAVAWLLVATYFAATGRANIFWTTAFVFPIHYAQNAAGDLPGVLARSVSKHLLTFLPCLALTIIGIGLAIRERRSAIRDWCLLLSLIAGTLLAIALPRQYFAHYFHLLLVPLTIGAGWGFVSLLEAVPRRWLGYGAGGVVIASLIYQQMPAYLLPASQWAVRQHGEIFAEWLQPVAVELDSMLGPDETFYQWADEPWLYFATGRRPPGAALWRMHTVDGPVADWLTQRTLEELKRTRPKIIVVWDGSAGPESHPIARWIADNYTPQHGAMHRYPLLFWLRKQP